MSWRALFLIYGTTDTYFTCMVKDRAFKFYARSQWSVERAVACMSRPIPVVWVCPLVNHSWWFRATSPFSSPSFLSTSLSISLSRLCESVLRAAGLCSWNYNRRRIGHSGMATVQYALPCFLLLLFLPQQTFLLSPSTLPLFQQPPKGKILIEWIQAGLQPTQRCVCVHVEYVLNDSNITHFWS